MYILPLQLLLTSIHENQTNGACRERRLVLLITASVCAFVSGSQTGDAVICGFKTKSAASLPFFPQCWQLETPIWGRSASRHRWCELKCLNEMCTEWHLKLILQISDSFHLCSLLSDSSETALRRPDGPIGQQFACPPRSICLDHVSIKHDNLDLDLCMTLQSYRRRQLYSSCPQPLHKQKEPQLFSPVLFFFLVLFGCKR